MEDELAGRRAENPFFNRGAIEDARSFVGRALEIREIFDYLDKPTPQSISLVGQRKIGKTSLLRHLIRPEVMQAHLADPGRLVIVPLNFEGMAYYSEVECLQKILWDTHAALAARGFSLPSEIKIDLLSATVFHIVETLNRLFSHLAAGPGARVVYLFDEFEVSCYNPHLTLSFFNTLRSFATNYGVAYVVASRRELYRLPVYRMGRSSPFFNYFSTVYLALFRPAEASQLIALARGTGVSLADEADYLVRRAGRFPFFLQLICWYFWDQMRRGHDRSAANRLFVEQATPHFDRFWSRLSEGERAAARGLAEGHHPSESQSSFVDVLERAALVEREGGEARLFSEAFSDFARSAPVLQEDTSPPDPPA